MKLTGEQRVQGLLEAGLPESAAKFLANIEVSTASGAEETMNDVVERVTGRAPKTFAAFAEENKAVWQ